MKRRPNMNPKNAQQGARQGQQQNQQQQQQSQQRPGGNQQQQQQPQQRPGGNQQQRPGGNQQQRPINQQQRPVNQQRPAGAANQQQRAAPANVVNQQQRAAPANVVNQQQRAAPANVVNQQQKAGTVASTGTANQQQQQKVANAAPTGTANQQQQQPKATAAAPTGTAANNQPQQQQQQEQNAVTTQVATQPTRTVTLAVPLVQAEAQLPATSTATTATTLPTPTPATSSAAAPAISAAAGDKQLAAEQKEDLATQLNSLFGAQRSEMPIQDDGPAPTTSVRPTEKRITRRNRWEFLLRLYVFTILFSCHAVAQFIMLHLIHESHSGKCYIGLTWLVLSVALFIFFISFDELRFGFPANWVIAVLIMLSLTFSLAMVVIVDMPLHVLWTSVWTFIALLCMIILGAIRPRSITPAMWIIIMTTVFANIGVFGLMLIYWLWQINVDAHAFRFAVLFWVFPIALYHSENVHGHCKNGMPLDDLPLCIILLFLDFLIIYVGLFWADGFAGAIHEMYLARIHTSQLQKTATMQPF